MFRCLAILITVNVLVLFVVYQYLGNRGKYVRQVVTKDQQWKTGIERGAEGNDIPWDLLKRTSTLRYQCAKHYASTFTERVLLHTAEEYNLKLCKVPKTGSTFWMQVLNILNDKSTVKDTFGQSRGATHVLGLEMTEKTNISGVSSDDIVIMMARDPFSRLYSAYVDKFFLPLYWGITPKVDQSSSCGNDIDFSDFIEFVVLQSRMDDHWIPVSRICSPCSIPYSFILKTETYKRDTSFILNTINITDSIRTQLLRRLVETNVEDYIHGFLKELLHYGKVQESDCLSFPEFAKRVWKVLQIQGHIGVNVTYPEGKFRNLDFSSFTEIKSIIVDGLNSHQLSSTEKQEQRSRYLRDAYRNINSTLIEGIKHVYERDFILFGYSPIPPHLKQN